MPTIIGLPVADITKSTNFFTAIGFAVNPYIGDEHIAAITLDDGATLMLYAEPVFTAYTGVEVTDLTASREVMNGFAAESREQVDEVADKALAAGATPIGEAQELDGMYMRAFRDLDGHWWSLNHVDMSAMSDGS